MTFFWRLTRVGLVAALAVGAVGWGLERARFGTSDEDAVARAATELNRRFEAAADTLAVTTTALLGDADTIARASRDADALGTLFARAAAVVPGGRPGPGGVTIYRPDGEPLAWAGRVSELGDRAGGPAALLMASGPPGPRLVRVQPVVATGRPPGERTAVIIAERPLGEPGAGLSDTLVLPTLAGPAAVRAVGDRAPADGPPPALTVPLNASDGTPLAVATFDRAEIQAARVRWERRTAGAVLVVLAVLLVVGLGPLVDRQRRARDRRGVSVATSAVVLTLVAARIVLWFALAPFLGGTARSPTSSFDLLLTALVACAVVWLVLDLEDRRRPALPHARLLATRAEALAPLVPAYALAGGLTAWGLEAYARVLRTLVSGAMIDLLHFWLHPPSAARLALGSGLLLLHAAVVWAGVTLARVPALVWRTRRDWHVRIGAAAWAAGAIAGLAALRLAMPVAPLLAALVGVALCRAAVARSPRHSRRSSQAARLAWIFLALLVPALAMYPTLLAFTEDAKEDLVSTVYAPQVASMREDLQDRLRRALEQIDSRFDLAAEPPAPGAEGTVDIDRAFAIWQQTDLATYRLTSAVELYNARGRLVSRFALSLPEQATPEYRAAGCDWDMVEETSPLGASDRHVLRASRGICATDRRLVGAIVVRVMLDYRRLFFVAPQNPYLESLRADSPDVSDGAAGGDVELAMYGWSRTPVEATDARVWLLPDAVFERLVASRAPFWTNLRREGETYRVYLLNDRGGIYALGYPVITTFGHLLNLAELTTLAGVLYVLLLAIMTVGGFVSMRSPTSGRALLREIRSSFYRKLVLYFFTAAVLPVAVLALTARAYLTSQLNAREEESAAQTATVARRLVEDYVTLQQRNAIALIDDQLLVLVSRAIDQDVNLFEGAELQATSNRALFASGVLTERTPSDVYAGIVLDRQKTFVGVETVGGAPYLLAAEPVRAGGREGIVTVPLTLRQAETERQRDELDRRVLFGAVFFSLVGIGLGYWLAERVADPVNRLTRATRRIARGDFDARIAATSTDELRRLVEDFNRMAAELQRQRLELERTQRLEAWAEMARQVAHEIKNPLTPIQLSAEHVRRVNQDRGRPLSPVLDDCITAILTQVRLLRQIASEFSSFASSPTARLESTDLATLIEEVVAPYRAGLAGRVTIALDADATLPPILLDRTLFARALTNVIENALHAMPGGGSLSVASRPSSLDGRPSIVVEVRDTGVGMDPDAAARIFEPYFSTKATGTGLGLTIAKRNIELNGGTIDVESVKGRGTTVRIELLL